MSQEQTDDSSSFQQFVDPLSESAADVGSVPQEESSSLDIDFDKIIKDMDLTKDVDSDDYDYSLNDDPDAQDLFITVNKPEKHILAMETYISYKVSMKTTRSLFDDCKYSVKRRFQDFVWLRTKLEESHPTHFIPPLPSKLIVKGMVERFTQDFVNTRQQALDIFMKRIAEHPVLSYNHHLKIFLTAKAHEFTQHRKQNSGGYLSKVGDSVKWIASAVKLKNRDAGFAEMSEKVLQFQDKMGIMERVSDRILIEQRELPFELQEYSSAYSMWAEAEQNDISTLLNNISKTLQSCADSADVLEKKHMRKILPPIKEYSLYCDSIEQVLRRRDNLQSQRDRLIDELQRKKEEKDNLPKADQSYSLGAMMGRKPDDVRKEKDEKLQQNIEELTKKHEDLCNKVTCANANITADMDRWEERRLKDVRSLLSLVADSHLESLSKEMTSWESLIPILQHSTTAGSEEETS